ncbi:hypothetical protein PoB_000762700 [Plakobranchus ocellatus]|uniref:Uncharacterized protein n=1 Tax=Plakobranchus ocellatus TaxID=259542 RepID=A0AAV3YE09_9GAST|nr:hypothetical protein PoB_000762700 [Plakobranchus ocellatus]
MDYNDIEHEMDIHSYACVTVADNEIDLSSECAQDVSVDYDRIANYNGLAFELDVDLSANQTTETAKQRGTGLLVALSYIVQIPESADQTFHSSEALKMKRGVERG